MTSRFLMALLSLCGLAIALTLSGAQVSGTSSCPPLFGVPACFLVAGGYVLILISTGLLSTVRKVVFLVGLVPVLLLASLASVLEFLLGPVCPSPYGRMPLCYVSLTLSLLIGGTWLLDLRRSRARSPVRRFK